MSTIDYITHQWTISGNPDWLKVAMLLGIVACVIGIVRTARSIMRDEAAWRREYDELERM